MHGAFVTGNGDRDPGSSSDRSVLAQQHPQDDLVDLVVRPVVGDDPNRRYGLAESVDATLPLLESGRVPGQVVVNDGVEVILEVDAL